MSSIRGFDNLFQDSVNDIALHNYNKGLAHRLRLAEMEAQQKLSFKEPKLLGGVRFSNSILPGSSVEEPATLAVGGGRAYRTFTGDETPAQGGKINRLKKFKKWTGAIGDLVPKSTRKALTERVNREIEGGKVNRLKKFKKWTGAIGDLVPKSTKKALTERVNREIEYGGKVNRLKKFKNWTSAIGDLVPKSTRKALTERVNREIEYGGMVYSNELKKALGSNKKLEGGAKRTGRLVKGSPEAKAWAEKMRQAREARR